MTDPKEVLEIPKDNAILDGSFATFEKFGYSPAVRAGGLLFIAGVVGARPDGSVPDSVGEQAELAFQRTAGILRLERLTMADLVEVVSYHVDLKEPCGLSSREGAIHRASLPCLVDYRGRRSRRTEAQDRNPQYRRTSKMTF